MEFRGPTVQLRRIPAARFVKQARATLRIYRRANSPLAPWHSCVINQAQLIRGNTMQKDDETRAFLMLTQLRLSVNTSEFSKPCKDH